LLNEAAANVLVDCSIVRQGGLDVSDHAPLVLDLDL
jgi:exonuclease III